MISAYVNPQLFSIPMNLNDFEFLQELGSGAHGKVFKVKYIKTGYIYALKQLPHSLFKNQSDEIDFAREITILYDITQRNSPHVVKLYANFQDMSFRYLIMELTEGTSLEKLRGIGTQKHYVDENLVISILMQLLETLKFLHEECKIIHRDIKPDNIFLGKDNNIKLLDFGLSAYLENPNNILVSRRSLKGAVRYAPPEILMFQERIYDYKIDIFSLGFTMYSLMNPSTDPKKPNLPQITEKKDGNFLRYKSSLKNDYYSSWLIDFVKSLYDIDQAKRPSAADALGLLKQLISNPEVKKKYNSLKTEQTEISHDISNIVRKQDNINNAIFSQIEINNNNMANSFQQLNQNFNINPPVNNNFMRANTIIVPEAEEFLSPNHGKENKILSSMKSLLLILYKLNVKNFINPISVLYPYCQTNYKDSGLVAFYNIIDSFQCFENGNINQQYFTQMINNFIRTVFIKSNCGISGNRPIILYYMIASMIKNDFKQYFDFYKNNLFNDVISYNYMSFNCVVPMNNQTIYNSISGYIRDFINKYKGLFVDNFYFITLSASRCPNCGNLFGIRNHICTFLQLDVPNPQNDIMQIIKDYFSPQPGTGNYNCTKCGLKGKKMKTMYFCNFPNYLFLEFEDKNKIIFTENIMIPLYNGQTSYYQYCASIYKYKMNDVSCFAAIIKYGNVFYFYCNDTIKQCDPSFVNMECPSLAVYKRIFN